MSHRSVAEALGRALPQLEVRHLFGLIGSGNFELAAAAVEAGVTFVGARHEAGAVAMANGYAQAAGGVGVATVHQGPGFTNALTSLIEATKSRTPLVLLAADTAASDTRSNFALDQAALAATAGSEVLVVDDARTALDVLATAFSHAVCKRRVVTVLLPVDVQVASTPPGVALPSWRPIAMPRTPPSQDAVDSTVRLIAASARPLVVAGRGATIAGAAADLLRLAESAGAAVATTAMAKSMFRGDPYDLGTLGWFCPPATAAVAREADLVIAFGASLNRWTTCDGDLIDPAATIVQVDDEPDAVGGHHRVDRAIIGDAALVAGALTRQLAVNGAAAPRWRTPELSRRLRASGWPEIAPDDEASEQRIDPRRFTRALDDMLPHEVTVAPDSGHFLAWPAMYLTVPDPRGYVFSQTFQSVGLGLATGIGAAVGRPDRLTVVPVGDGGALMAAGELETIGRLGLPMLVVVYNDAAYGAEVHHFGMNSIAEQLVCFPETDFASLGASVGCEAVTVRNIGDLQQVSDWLDRRDRPLVVDAKIDRSVVVSFLNDALRSEPTTATKVDG